MDKYTIKIIEDCLEEMIHEVEYDIDSCNSIINYYTKNLSENKVNNKNDCYTEEDIKSLVEVVENKKEKLPKLNNRLLELRNAYSDFKSSLKMIV